METVFYQGYRGERVLLVDWRTAGKYDQPFEQRWTHVVVLDDIGADLRQFERLGEKSYAIHHERIDRPMEHPLSRADEVSFSLAFGRAFTEEGMDVRDALRLAIKALP